MKVPAFFEEAAGNKLYEVARSDPKDRAFVEDSWRRFAPLCGDPINAFLSDARRNFYARLWEMRLACALLDVGMELVRPPQDGPDICVIEGERRVWIEATAVEPGQGADAVPQIRRMGTINRDAFMLRYTTALKKKSDQRHAFIRRGAIAAEDAFLTAINAGQLDLAHIERGSSYPDIVRAVYPIGPLHFVIPVVVARDQELAAGETQVRAEHPYRASIPRALAGAGIPASAFLDELFEGVSGLLFTASEPWVVDRDKLLLVHNHLAATPVKRGWLQVGREYWYEAGEESFAVRVDDRRPDEMRE
jgi:hypothetical protein